MKLFKSAFLLFLFYVISICGINAQGYTDTDGKIENDSQNSAKKTSLLSPSRMSFKLGMGAGFIGGSNSGMFTYLSPFIRYSVTPKFKLDAGGIISEGTNLFSNVYAGNKSTTNVLLFARGNYLLTDKLTITGSYYKSFYPGSGLNTEQNNYSSSKNYSYSLGMDYKINKHMSFGAQVIVNKGINNNYLFQSQPSLFGGFPGDNNRNGLFGW